MQVKALEPDVQSLRPYKSKLAAAEQLLAMLAGSKQINPRKGQADINIDAAPQVRLHPAVQRQHIVCMHSVWTVLFSCSSDASRFPECMQLEAIDRKSCTLPR